MPVDQMELARRLRVAREASGLTQDQVADHLGTTRSTIAQMELGKRSVTSLELDRLSHLYGRLIAHFLAEDFDEADPLVVLFRLDSGVASDETLSRELRECAALCREATNLEQLLELTDHRALPTIYSITNPTTKWEAIQQGRRIAALERNRLNLGNAPIWDMAAILEPQGIRWIERSMPPDVSGMFLASDEVGLCVIVNSSDDLRRRSYSYAHEYSHLLLDRNRKGNVSRHVKKDDLIEVRANAFAASFLMPDEAIRDFLHSLGKGQERRAIATAFDEAGPVTAQHRTPPHSQDIQLYDVVQLACHFGVSFPAATYRLRNMRFITEEQMKGLLEKKDAANTLYSKINRTVRSAAKGREDLFETRLLFLAMEAYRRDLVTRRKLGELARLLSISENQLEDHLQFAGLEHSIEMGPDDVRIPD